MIVTTDKKQILLNNTLIAIKKQYGDMFTNNDIQKSIREFIEDAYNISFDSSLKCIYEGNKYNVSFEIIVHYENRNIPCYEVIEDVYHIETDETECNLVCFSHIKSVVDMFLTNTLGYWGQ